MMSNPIKSFLNAAPETKQFIITLAILFVIVLGANIFAYSRVPSKKIVPKQQQEQSSTLDRADGSNKTSK